MLYTLVIRYMYTENRQMRNMIHDTSVEKHKGARLKFELNNYLFRGLIKLRKYRFMPLEKLHKYRFDFTNISTLVYHSIKKRLTKPNKMFKTRGGSTNSQSLHQ